MGTYNYTLVEKLGPISKLWDIEETTGLFGGPQNDDVTVDNPFEYQSYPIAAFIAGERNYYDVTPIAEGRGLPSDHKSIKRIAGFGGQTEMISRYESFLVDGESYCWVLLSELVDFNYDDTFENRRANRGHNDTVPAGEGEIQTYKEFLGERYFKNLKVLQQVGEPSEIRIVFRFSS
jgi:hypothetical protein